MSLDDKSARKISELFDSAEESFEGMSNRWEDLKPKSEFNVKNLEDFHIGYIFGNIEERFIKWFYTEKGRSPSDQEYKEFWLICRKRIRKMHELFDRFYFQE